MGERIMPDTTTVVTPVVIQPATKPWYMSFTIYGATLIAICSVILPLLGKGNVADALTANKTDIMSILDGIGSVIGTALVVYGRIKASTQLTLTNKNK
jgi:hypothetical protein